MVITGLASRQRICWRSRKFHASSDWRKFSANQSGAGLTIVVGGTARTTCALQAARARPRLRQPILATAEIICRDPNQNLTQSNTVNFVVVSHRRHRYHSTHSTNPSATGKDIIVVEPFDAVSGTSTERDNRGRCNGHFFARGDTCSLGAGSLIVTRPYSGTAIVDICVFSIKRPGSIVHYSLTGPALADIRSSETATWLGNCGSYAGNSCSALRVFVRYLSKIQIKIKPLQQAR